MVVGLLGRFPEPLADVVRRLADVEPEPFGTMTVGLYGYAASPALPAVDGWPMDVIDSDGDLVVPYSLARGAVDTRD